MISSIKNFFVKTFDAMVKAREEEAKHRIRDHVRHYHENLKSGVQND